MHQFPKKLKLCMKLVPRQHIKIFPFIFICNNLYLLSAIFIIYFQSYAKVFSTTGTSQWMTGSSGVMSVAIYELGH